MLLSRVQNITYYAFEKCPFFLKLCHLQFCLIKSVYGCIRFSSSSRYYLPPAVALKYIISLLRDCSIRVIMPPVIVLLELPTALLESLYRIVQSSDFFILYFYSYLLCKINYTNIINHCMPIQKGQVPRYAFPLLPRYSYT